MSDELKVGDWVSENYRIIAFVGKLAIIENVPGFNYTTTNIQYFVRVGTNNYVRADGTAGYAAHFDKALFDTQSEAEQLAKKYLALEAAESEREWVMR